MMYAIRFFISIYDELTIQIVPCADLEWIPCFDKFSCARLIVPLDYSDTSVGNTTIAYIKLSAAKQPAQDILFNPGGPGGSGVQSVLSSSDRLLQTLGSSYNLIGFDPRSVNNSGPSISCFPNDTASETLFSTQFKRPMNSKSRDSVVRQFELAGAWGDWCSQVHQDDHAKYASTVATAQDLLNYVEKEAVSRGEKAEEAQLWYWGLSYGTVLGATYASLFPDRIGRLILDGVVDSQTYYRGKFGGLGQSDEAVLSFAKDCQSAGKEKCSFYSATAEEIATRMRAVLENLRNDPVPVTNPAVAPLPILITYEDLVFTMFALTYTPVSGFPLLAQIFSDLEHRDGASLAQVLQAEPPTGVYYGGLIACMDMHGAYNISTLEMWEQHIEEVNNKTSWVGDAWSSVALSCRQMKMVPPASQQFHGEPGANQTSFPILFIGNRVDPITPLVE